MTTNQQLVEHITGAQPASVAFSRYTDGGDLDLGTYVGRLEPVTSRVFGEEQRGQEGTTMVVIHQEALVFPEVVVNVGRGDIARVSRDSLPLVEYRVLRVDRYVYKTDMIVERRD